MCIIFATLTWPENPADAISEVLNSKNFLGRGGACPQTPIKERDSAWLAFHTLHSTVYVALRTCAQATTYPILATPLCYSCSDRHTGFHVEL